jgi:tyrosine-protein phosphatase YwqE
MLTFFKTKSKLVDLIPEGYIDIHSHVLPGIDDGSKSFDETVILLEGMLELGMKGCVPTPHTIPYVWDNSKEEILDNYTITKEKLPLHLKKMLLNISTEYMVDDTFLERIKNETLLSISDEFVLIEMSYLNPFFDFSKVLFELQMKRYKIILAHPERYLYYHKDKNVYHRLKELGCLFQLNLLSTVGYYGKEVASVSDYLLKNNLIDFVGSDIHHQKHLQSFYNSVIVKSENELHDCMKNNSKLVLS